MLTSIIITAILGLIGVTLHRRTRVENKLLKHIPVSEWLNVLIFPMGFYICWVIFVRNVIGRPMVPVVPMDDFDVLAVSVFFMVFAFVGNGLHFTGKILWRYLKDQPQSMAYKVNELFHGKISHYIIYCNSFIVFFLLSILEINHPLPAPLPSYSMNAIIAAGVIFGVSATKSIFYPNEWFGGLNKPLFIICLILFATLFSISKTLGLDSDMYPMKLFITWIYGSVVMTFIIRQVMIYTRLSNRKRLQFLARLLSV